MDYNLKSRPRISESVFARVLVAAGSPAAHEAKACYDAIVKHGIDPALALAQFDKESTYGKFGLANSNKSWGNLRGYPSGEFKRYTSWAAGTDDYARLLAGTLYAGSANYHTARTMPYRYAPAADHNAPAAYGAFLVNMIQHYMSLMPAAVKYYTVVSGDNLSSIANRYKISLARIESLNPQITNPDLIHVGQRIRVA